MADVHDIASSPRMRFSAAFDELEVAYDRKVTVSRREVYWKYLKKVPIDDLVAAVSLCVDHYTAFPKIPQWRKMAELVRRRRDESVGPTRTGDGVPLKELPAPASGPFFCNKCSDKGWEPIQQWVEEMGAHYPAVRKCCRDGSNPRVTALFNLRIGAAPKPGPYFEDENEKEAASRREEREPSMFE